jgi:hypothetical protein
MRMPSNTCRRSAHPVAGSAPGAAAGTQSLASQPLRALQPNMVNQPAQNNLAAAHLFGFLTHLTLSWLCDTTLRIDTLCVSTNTRNLTRTMLLLRTSCS